MNDTRHFYQRWLLTRRGAVLSFIIPLIAARARARFAACAAAAATCLIAFPARGTAQTLVFAEAEAEARAEEIPAPTPVIEGLQNDIRRLEKEIEALRAEQAAPAADTAAKTSAEKPAEKAGDAAAEKKSETLIDRLSAVEKSLGKLVDASDKKKQDEAKKPLFILSGQVQVDQVYFSQDPQSRAALGDLQDGAQFRRLRIGGRGTAFDVFEYALGVDFALANQPSFLDNYIEWRELPWLQHVRAGQYFEPFSLERVTQNRNNTFMERSLVDTFAPARNVGIMTYGATESELATWAIGTFRSNSDNVGNDSFDSGQALTMRGTWLPWWDEASEGRYYMHLGAAYSFRDAYEDQVRFRNTPEIRKAQPLGSPTANPGTPPFAPIFVDTGNIKDVKNFQLFDPEFAIILGPWSLQSEYAFAAVNRTGRPDLFFNGYMAQLSYFLTGEHRPYDRQLGIHKRVHPFEDFFRVRTESQGIQTGLGAWEIAARFSNIVLNDKDIEGNNLTDFTFGLNWYLNPYTRWKFNYVRAFLQDERKGNSITDAYGMRFDYDF